MLTRSKLMLTRSKATAGRYMPGLVIAALWMIATASAAHAHGGIAGPDELGPPVITSAMLGVVCYWIVMLWPSRRPRNGRKSAKVARRMTR